MRFITGLLVGIVMTIGAAYVADAMHAAPGDGAGGTRRMVNWEVVSDNLGDLSSDVRSAWARLVGGAKEIDKKVDKTGT
jgi:hypothetical protein